MMIKYNIDFRSGGGKTEVGNMKKKNEDGTDSEWRCLSFMTHTKTSLMMLTLMITVFVVVLGDDAWALRNTLTSLCSLNQKGVFGSCCRSYSIESVGLGSSAARNCFISSIISNGGSITTLFVFTSVILLFSSFSPWK